MGHTKVHEEMVHSGKNLTDLHKTQSGTLIERLWYEWSDLIEVLWTYSVVADDENLNGNTYRLQSFNG